MFLENSHASFNLYWNLGLVNVMRLWLLHYVRIELVAVFVTTTGRNILKAK